MWGRAELHGVDRATEATTFFGGTAEEEFVYDAFKVVGDMYRSNVMNAGPYSDPRYDSGWVKGKAKCAEKLALRTYSAGGASGFGAFTGSMGVVWQGLKCAF